MRKVLLSLPRIGFLILLSLGGGTQSAALADGNLNHHLRGDYRASLIATCVVDSIGFGDNLQRLGVGTSFDITISGILHYNGDGTGSFANHRIRILDGGPAPLPLFEADGNCTLTYTVNADGTFTQQANCTSTILKGVASPPQTLTENGVRLDGTIAAGFGRRILLLSNANPVQDTVSITGAPTITQKRICGYSGTAVRVRLDGQDDEN